MAKFKKSDKPAVRGQATVKHEFTEEEKRERTEQLVQSLQQVRLKKEGIKAAAATARAEVKELEARAEELANQLQNGSEQRTVDVTVEFHRARGVKKLYLHCPGKPEHGDFVRQEPMTEDDFQTLPLQDEPAPRAEGPEGAAAEAAGQAPPGTVFEQEEP